MNLTKIERFNHKNYIVEYSSIDHGNGTYTPFIRVFEKKTEGEELLFELKRYHHSKYTFFERLNVPWLFIGCNESQIFINLQTKEVFDTFKRKSDNSYETQVFWDTCYISPDGRTLVAKCYFYNDIDEYIFFDFSYPEKGPLFLLQDLLYYNDYTEVKWEEDKFIYIDYEKYSEILKISQAELVHKYSSNLCSSCFPGDNLCESCKEKYNQYKKDKETLIKRITERRVYERKEDKINLLENWELSE